MKNAKCKVILRMFPGKLGPHSDPFAVEPAQTQIENEFTGQR